MDLRSIVALVDDEQDGIAACAERGAISHNYNELSDHTFSKDYGKKCRLKSPKKSNGKILTMEMERLTRQEYGFIIAIASGLRSEDPHTQVGAALFERESGRLISSGYNGLSAGTNWVSEFNENRGLKADLIIHAEQNLNFRDPKVEKTLFLTMDPCGSCASLISSPLSNVKEVYSLKEYESDKEKKYQKIFDFYNIKFRRATAKELKNIYAYMNRASVNIDSILSNLT